MKKKLIIGFIVKGLQTYYTHIQHFIGEAQKRGHETIIFHLNEYYGTSEIGKNDIPVLIFNLEDYWNYPKLFRSLNLDILIFLNPGNLFDIFLIDLLKQTRVKTIYLQHGVKANIIQKTEKVQRIKSKSIGKYFFFYNRIVYSLFCNKMKKRRFINTLQRIKISIFQSSSEYVSLGLPSTHCDYALVYTLSDIQVLIDKIKYSEKSIYKIGMPFIKPKETNRINEINENHKKVALYISSGLRQASVVNINDGIEQDMYRTLHYAAQKANHSLIVKIHPRENFAKVKSYFASDKDIIVYKDSNIADLVIKADVVLGDYSTALLYAVKYYKPIGLLSYDYFDIFPFDLTLYKIGHKIHLGNLSEFLRIYKETDVDKPTYDNCLKVFNSAMDIPIEERFHNILESLG